MTIRSMKWSVAGSNWTLIALNLVVVVWLLKGQLRDPATGCCRIGSCCFLQLSLFFKLCLPHVGFHEIAKVFDRQTN